MATQACPDCGGDKVNHQVEYVAVLLDTLVLPLFVWPEDVWRRTKALFANQGASSQDGTARVYALLAKIGLGVFLDKPDSKTLLLDHMLWEEAARRGIQMREFRFLSIPNNSFVAVLPSGRTLTFGGIPPMPKTTPAWWVNNKSILKQKFGALGMPVPRGGSFYLLDKAQQFFTQLERPIITKPTIGSASRHTTMHVHDIKTLNAAFANAKKISPFVIVEEELSGCVYRPTVVGGKLLATLRRDQPFVIGDGTSTVEQLVEEENKNPKRSGPYFHPIVLNEAAHAELRLQNLTEESVPAAGQRVQLHPKINWGVGGTTTDVTDEVHPDNVELFERVAEALNISLVGIDFIIEDISRSWKEQSGCGIIECNDMPYFDNHHLPYQGEPRDIAGPVWDLVTP